MQPLTFPTALTSILEHARAGMTIELGIYQGVETIEGHGGVPITVPAGTFAQADAYLRKLMSKGTLRLAAGDDLLSMQFDFDTRLDGKRIWRFGSFHRLSKQVVLRMYGADEQSTAIRLLVGTTDPLLLLAPTVSQRELLVEFISPLLQRQVVATGDEVRSGQVIIGVAPDLVTGLMSYGKTPRDLCVVQVALVRTVCTHCAKSVRPDSVLLEKLPVRCGMPLDARYQVGRGCDKCAGTGSGKLQMIASGIRLDEPLRELFAGRMVERLLATEIHRLGGRSLLEEATVRAWKGEMSLEAIFEAVGELSLGSTSLLDIGAALKVPASGDDANRVAHLAGGAKKVLIVEDDPDQREVLAMALQAANYEVAQAANGAEALATLERTSVDLIITDLMMPVMDGAALTAALRAQGVTTPVLVLTVLGDESRECALLDLGADDYCAKNIQRRTLVKRIEALLRRS